jgi:hypothetical protein
MTSLFRVVRPKLPVWGFDGATLKPSEDIYTRDHLLREYRTSTMDGTAHPTNVPVTEIGPRKPRTLVLCFDGTSNEFHNQVRQTAHSSDVLIPLDIMIS